MNRPVFLMIITFAATIAVVCRENNQMPKGSCRIDTKPGMIAVIDSVRDSLRIDSLFDILWQLERAVAEKPDDQKRIKDLLAKSLDTAAGCFYIVGKGLKNPDLPDEARPLARKAAAKYSAEKWVLYLKAVYSGEKIAYGSPVAGEVLYKKDLRTRIVDDSLFVLVMVPVGSVVVKQDP